MATATAPAPSPERERDAADRLSRVHGAGELQAVLLALLMAPGSKRALRAWQRETAATPAAESLRRHAASLSGAARLPWFELLLARMAVQPLAARQELLQATRRVMGARGVARPIDRLHWLTMRRGLGEVGPLAARAESHGEAPEWLESDVLCVASCTAFLSRMVPGEGVDSPDGRAWYDLVMATWLPFVEIPAWQPPKAEAMVEALLKLQTLSAPRVGATSSPARSRSVTSRALAGVWLSKNSQLTIITGAKSQAALHSMRSRVILPSSVVSSCPTPRCSLSES